MNWWARRRLRVRIFLPFSSLILATVLGTLVLINSAVTRQVESSLQSQLVVTGQVFHGLVTERAQRMVANVSLLASDFALKRAIATYDPATLQSVAVNYGERIGADLLWIVDEGGVLLADSRGRSQAGRKVEDLAPLSRAIAAKAAVVTITDLDGALVQLVAVPVLAPDPIAYLIAGEAIDDQTATGLKRQTGSEVSFVTRARLFASSWDPPQRAFLAPGAAPAASILEPAPTATFLTTNGHERLLSILVPIDAAMTEPLFALVQQSYDRALQPLYQLRRRVTVIGSAALAGALLAGALLASGIAAPLQILVGGMRDVLTGNFRRRVQLGRQDEIGFLAESFNEMVAGLEEREMIKETFGRFVSRDVAAAILEGRVPLAGERREVTILFQDTRGFTTIAERLEPGVLVRIVNRLFTEMVAAVEAEGGIIKQFTGDGVMALFGAPVAHADDPDRAVRAACRMIERLPALNAQLSAEQLPALRIGIGVHTGEVVAGNVGPDQRLEYNVIGDAVNLASRIEGLTKEVRTAILVSATTASRLGPGFQFGRRPVLAVKGKEKPVEVVEIVGCTGIVGAPDA